MPAAKSIHLALGIHNHQPVGTPASLFEERFQSIHEPFLKLLSKHPKVKVSMHFSGILLQWLVEKHPEYANRLRDLNNKGQIELLTGGYYEPILSAIPDRDKTGQIGKLTKYIEEKFSFTPKGIWVTERIWEPHLPKSLAEAGAEYTLLNESHFKEAGIVRKEELLGYHVTEEQGNTIAVFPIHEKLSRAVSDQSIAEILETVRQFADEDGNRLICFAGKRETFDSLQWLEKFFEKIGDAKEIKITSFYEYRKKFPPIGRFYIPGGLWRNFMVKYPEVNDLHKKQLYVSHKVEKVKELEIKTRAQEDLWRGQAGDAYRQDLCGGLYLPNLRSSAYQSLIKSEYLVDMYLHHGGPWLDVEVTDYDKDLMDEVIINSDKLNLYLRPSRGGQLFELDYKSRACNFQGLMSRKDENPRYSLVDHFLDFHTTLADFCKTKYQENGDFVKERFHFDIERSHVHAAVKLTRDGHVAVKKESHPIRVEKRVIVPRGESHFTVEFHLTNGTSHSLPLWYAPELSFNFLSCDSNSAIQLENRTVGLKETSALKGINNLILRDGSRKVEITMTFSKTAEIWTFPIETEGLYQGTVLLPHWQVTLGPKGTWKAVVTFHLKDN